MQITTTFRHMEPNESLKKLVHDKVAKLETFIPGQFEANVVLFSERHLHGCRITVQAPWGHTYQTEERNEDIFAAITKAIAHIERQTERDKGRMRAHRAGGA